MNSVAVAFIAIAIFVVAYKYYGGLLERLFGIDPKKQTPAHTKYDGIDYVPAKHWGVLFGHHFASIAGAGPIVGPVLACAVWGWGPSILWIVLGTIFIGGVHDFGSLIASVRSGGSSIADIAKDVISHRAKVIFSSFVLLALILVIAVFTDFCAQTFVSEPKIVIPSLGLIPVAFLVGLMLYRLNMNLAFTTLFGLGLLSGLIFLGERMPVQAGNNGVIIWGMVLLAYCFVASVTPVQILLQPRDYLASFLLLFGVVFGFTGLILSHPTIKMPVYTQWNSANYGMLYPMLFVTVACGAVSGFHCLVSSGTTSKQLSCESDAKRIGYGAMLAEGVVGVLAVMCVAAGIKDKDTLMFFLTSGGGGPIAAYAQGYSELAKPILFGYGRFVAIMVLNGFILTSLDTATRIARYLMQELFGINNRYLATIGVIFFSGLLLLFGGGNKLWPTFGAANQLVGALALIVITSWLLSSKRRIRYTLLPSIFMSVVTIIALLYQMSGYIKAKNYVLFAVSLSLWVLAGYMIFEVIRYVRINRSEIRRELCSEPFPHKERSQENITV